MPDLSIDVVHQFWADYDDPMIYRVIMFMEGVEPWTLDNNPELEDCINALGTELDDVSKVDFSELGHEDTFVRLAGNIKTGRALRLLQAIDSVHPGSASRVLIHAEENTIDNSDPPGIFLRRNIVFERLRLLARVFSKARMNMVLRALEGDDAEM